MSVRMSVGERVRRGEPTGIVIGGYHLAVADVRG
jgi:hypothetical protein